MATENKWDIREIMHLENDLKMEQNKRRMGMSYEQRAGGYLQEQGYEILEYNYRCPGGEVDIVARKDGCIVFCEVKYRKTAGCGHPLEAVTRKKQLILSSCARYYLATHQMMQVPCRFDVIGFLGEEVVWIQDAFAYQGRRRW